MVIQRMVMAAGLTAWFLSAGATAIARDRTLSACRQISDADQRLACFDAMAEADAKTTIDRQQKQFGLTEQQKAPEDRKEAEEVTAAVSSASGSQVQLDNDMVWRVVDNARAMGWIRPGQKATITRGLLSGYRMQVEGVNGIMVVARVR